jgi:hypothetical protein
VTDAFVVSTPVTDVLFRFTLDPTGSVTVTQLDVNYTTAGGVVDGDIDQGALWQDDGDGVWESGQDTQIQASISGSGGQLSFTTDFSPPASETVYFVRAQIANLASDDTITFSLGTGDIATDAAIKTGSASDSSHTMDSVGTDLCAFNFLTNHADVTPSSTGWQDVDVSSWVPASATGVILQAVNTGGSPVDFLVRKKVASSPDAYVNEEIEANAHAWPMVGVDSNRVFQAYTEDSTSVQIYLIGYTGSGVTFFDNRLDVTPASTGSWLDVDISSATGSDTAIAAIVGVFGLDGGASTSFGMRKNGVAVPDDRYATVDGDHQTWGIVGVDGSEVFENRTQNITSQKSYVYGYATSGIVMFDNAVDHSTATAGSYQDVDITSNLQGWDDANGAIPHLYFDTGDSGALRKNGMSYDRFRAAGNQC